MPWIFHLSFLLVRVVWFGQLHFDKFIQNILHCYFAGQRKKLKKTWTLPVIGLHQFGSICLSGNSNTIGILTHVNSIPWYTVYWVTYSKNFTLKCLILHQSLYSATCTYKYLILWTVGKERPSDKLSPSTATITKRFCQHLHWPAFAA